MSRKGDVAVSAMWVRQEESDGWTYLLNAFESSTDGDYASALIFAHSAVEISLTPVVAAQLRSHAAANEVDSFMRDSATFSGVLNVLLPNVCGSLGVPKMPDPERRALNRLRKMRNLLVHEGASRASVKPEDAADALSAAALGFEYARYISQMFSELSGGSPLVATADPRIGEVPHG